MNQQWKPLPKGDPPICRNCLHHGGRTGCSHPNNTKYNPVYGRYFHLDASDMRSHGSCGPDAKLFAQRIRWWDKIKQSFKRYLEHEGP